MGFDAEVAARLGAEGGEYVRRLFAKDPTLWVKGKPAERDVAERLGWLDAPRAMQGRAAELVGLADEVRRAGFRRVVLLGMGGSSLAPEVFARTMGSRPGYPVLSVLDSTDPAAVLATESAGPLDRTLFLVSSKSGTTIESKALFAYFWEQTGARGAQFVAITDPGTPLAALAESRQFRRVFLNPPDIGGRFSALSHFGLVPAALIGADVAAVLERAGGMLAACARTDRPAENPGAALGAALAAAWARGRDKATLVIPPALATFGAWVEQLLAESTGKEGKGLVPVVDEPLGGPEVYGSDRLFVEIASGDGSDAEPRRGLAALAAAGHPVVRVACGTPWDLGAEFVRWEVATALCGAWLGINPFDQPNVTESKANTDRLLRQLAAGESPEAPRTVEPAHLGEALAAWVRAVTPGDYVALLAYVQPAAEHDRLLQAIRLRVRDALGVATTVGYGPRFLHSTGQLHKGGSGAGVFLQIETEDVRDVPVPGETCTFGRLKLAQALGDLIALDARGRRILRVRVWPGELPRVAAALEEGLARR